MFSGIIEAQAQVMELLKGEPCSLRLQTSEPLKDLRIGDSICVNGVCLSLVEQHGIELSFDLASETLRCTNLHSLKRGCKVNLECSLKLGDKISGHFVFGHVDACVELLESIDQEGTLKLQLVLPDALAPFISPKGSLALNGVSLTAGEISSGTFSVYLIPLTRAQTNLGELRVGQKLNLEVDMLARYAVHGARFTQLQEKNRDYVRA